MSSMTPDFLPTDGPAGTHPGAGRPEVVPGWKPARLDSSDVVRRFGVVLALVFLAISLAVAYYSANSIVSIWFEEQWVPVARLVLALVVAGVAAWALLRLTVRR